MSFQPGFSALFSRARPPGQAPAKQKREQSPELHTAEPPMEPTPATIGLLSARMNLK
jgi:hypothetical protein